MGSINQNLLIWDSIGSPEPGHRKVVLWRSFSSKVYPNAVSMPKLIEENAIEIKNRFLSLIYDLGFKKCNGRSVIDHMQLRSGFNYWWLSLIIEKCNYSKSTWINDAIRLLAFEKWITEQNIKNLELVSANSSLANCIRIWCEEKEIEFSWQRLHEMKDSKSIFKRFYGYLPIPLQALVWFVFYFVSRWPMRGNGLEEWKSTKGRITFVSYLFNLEPESAANGRYASCYWAHLPNLLQRDGIATNWLHLYIKDDILPSVKKATETVYLFNKSGQGKQIHATSDTFLGWQVAIRSLLDWIRLLKAARKLKKVRFLDIGDEFNLRPLIENDLKESLYGRTALNNLIDFNLFEEALRLLPKQKKCIYLQENQGWEFALIQAWKLVSNGDLISVPHSTVRFWDLRYFFDKRSYNSDISNQLPRPDMVAVNGRSARNSYLQGGYPQNELVNVEALRYLHLKTFFEKQESLLNNRCSFKVLVLGDYLAENTHHQMSILEKAFPFFSGSVYLIVKSHPNCPINASDYPSLNLKISMDSISTLLKDCDVAYTSNVTSASIDAYYSGLPVISTLSPCTLNMSPLRGIERVEFISTADELVNGLEKVQTVSQKKTNPEDYFWLDPALPRWKKLLGKS